MLPKRTKDDMAYLAFDNPSEVFSARTNPWAFLPLPTGFIILDEMQNNPVAILLRVVTNSPWWEMSVKVWLEG